MSDAVGAIGASTSTSTADYAQRIPAQKLNQNDFLKLLVAQLSTQDPLNPQKDTEFIGQMAQFSQLESAKTMEGELQSMRANQLIGQTVEVDTGNDKTVAGMVTAVDTVNGEPRLFVGGEAYSLSAVKRVEQGITPPSV